MKYLDTKENSIEDSVTRVLMGEKKLDPVNPTAVKKKFDDRKDKDIDNDGDVDSTDKYLHKRRKAISKAVKSDEKSSVSENVKDIAMMMRDKKYKGRTSAFDAAVKKKYPREYDTNAVQDLIRKHAEMNEQMMFDEGKKLKSGVDIDFELYSDPKKKAANMAMNNEIRRAQMMKDYKTAREYMNKVQKKYSKLGAEDSEADRTIDKILGVVFGKVNMGADKKMFEYVELDEDMAALQRKLDKLYGPKKSKDIEKMMKDRKYKGNTSAFDAAVKKKYPNEYKTAVVQDMIRKHAEMNEQYNLDENFRKLAMKGMGTETKRDARVGLTTDFYLPQNGDKRSGKIMRVSRDGYEIMNDGSMSSKEKGMKYTFKFYDPKVAKKLMSENYEIGNDYAKHTLRVTPGQTESDVDEMLGIMEKKRTSMREALAKVWGLSEGKSPFDKKEEKKEEKNSKKTMTGKEPTPVDVDPEVKD